MREEASNFGTEKDNENFQNFEEQEVKKEDTNQEEKLQDDNLAILDNEENTNTDEKLEDKNNDNNAEKGNNYYSNISSLGVTPKFGLDDKKQENNEEENQSVLNYSNMDEPKLNKQAQEDNLKDYAENLEKSETEENQEEYSNSGFTKYNVPHHEEEQKLQNENMDEHDYSKASSFEQDPYVLQAFENAKNEELYNRENKKENDITNNNDTFSPKSDFQSSTSSLDNQDAMLKNSQIYGTSNFEEENSDNTNENYSNGFYGNQEPINSSPNFSFESKKNEEPRPIHVNERPKKEKQDNGEGALGIGIASILLCWVPILNLILGNIAISKSKKSQEENGTIGGNLGIISLLLGVPLSIILCIGCFAYKYAKISNEQTMNSIKEEQKIDDSYDDGILASVNEILGRNLNNSNMSAEEQVDQATKQAQDTSVEKFRQMENKMSIQFN